MFDTEVPFEDWAAFADGRVLGRFSHPGLTRHSK